MPRKPRITYAGAMYHVTVRGNKRRDIFLTDDDRLHFLALLSVRLVKHQVRLYQYCLMDNHFHLLVETPMANISRFMQSLNTAYTVYFNKKHGRIGPLFQGRYHGKPVQSDGYLLQLSRYIHLNPVNTEYWKTQPVSRRMQHLKTRRWSSYRAYLGMKKPIEGLEIAPIMALIGGHRRKPVAYQDFLRRGLMRPDAEFLALVESTAPGIGNPDFLGRLSARDPRTFFRRRAPVCAPEDVMAIVARTLDVPKETICQRKRGQLARGMSALLMIRHCGLNQSKVASLYGITQSSSISRQTRLIRRRLQQSARLRRQFENAERQLLEQHADPGPRDSHLS